MGSYGSKDEWKIATVKSGGQGYSSKVDYQSRRKSSQGKQDHSQRDVRQDKGCTEKRMRELEDKIYKLEENNKKLKAELKVSKKSTVSLQKEIFGTQMIGQVRKQTWQIR
jgi:predicted  nucleic acid-binding Zn-ribbon protein